MIYSPVHPRACGEQSDCRTFKTSLIGSSPRLRGTETNAITNTANIWFIPAPAGNRISTPFRASSRSVHPRACGEQPRESYPDASVDGSSPRLRGTDQDAITDPRVVRFIPAPAGNSYDADWEDSPISVHPRACGEQHRIAGKLRSGDGSSPRLRGTEYRSVRQGRVGRFIPAPAGNSKCDRSVNSPTTVHPRACGEQEIPLRAVSRRYGSSPRLRGTVLPLDHPVMTRRFIPAPAGNSPTRSCPRFAAPVHPRACGEQQLADRLDDGIGGSSPRLRGTESSPDRQAALDRFIPAPAGNRRRYWWIRSSVPVHPRACGEQMPTTSWFSPPRGSSPRLRGTVGTHLVRTWYTRFIPAPAGNRAHKAPELYPMPVHPRACGEQIRGCPSVGVRIGSSPRLRGTALRIIKIFDPDRFIPAPAGNSKLPASSRDWTTVHPRACGEQRVTHDLGPLKIGSSPRLRGTGPLDKPFKPHYRFIPAPAGNRSRILVALNHLPVHPRACGEQCNAMATRTPSIGSSPRLRGTGQRVPA